MSSGPVVRPAVYAVLSAISPAAGGDGSVFFDLGSRISGNGGICGRGAPIGVSEGGSTSSLFPLTRAPQGRR